MQRKVKLLIIFNILFYVLIFLHKWYSDDYLPQVLFYMALAFSSIVLEESFRNKLKKINFYSLVDFSIRIVVLIIHFGVLIFKINIWNINLITISLFVANILIEGIILEKVKNIKEDELEIIKQSDINKFINDFKLGKLDYYGVSIDLKKEISSEIKALEISGKSTIVIVILLVVLFILRFTYEHFIQLVFVPIILIIFLLYILFKLLYEITNIIYVKNKKRRFLINIITFIIGYLILLISEVIFYGKMGYLDVSIRVIGILFFIPIFNTKYTVKNEIKIIIKKYYKKR